MGQTIVSPYKSPSCPLARAVLVSIDDDNNHEADNRDPVLVNTGAFIH